MFSDRRDPFSDGLRFNLTPDLASEFLVCKPKHLHMPKLRPWEYVEYNATTVI